MEDNIQIEISTELRDDIQRANIEFESYYNILTYILNNNIDIPKERFNQYLKKYDEKLLLFNQLKNKLEKEYININKKDDKNIYQWQLDYNTSIVTVNIIKE